MFWHDNPGLSVIFSVFDDIRLFASAAFMRCTCTMSLSICAPMFDFLITAPKRKKTVDVTVMIGAACPPGEEPQ
jgi:hypothetical protein